MDCESHVKNRYHSFSMKMCFPFVKSLNRYEYIMLVSKIYCGTAAAAFTSADGISCMTAMQAVRSAVSSGVGSWEGTPGFGSHALEQSGGRVVHTIFRRFLHILQLYPLEGALFTTCLCRPALIQKAMRQFSDIMMNEPWTPLIHSHKLLVPIRATKISQ